MGALSEVVRQGKARYIGFSEWSAEQIEAAFGVAGSEHFVSSQPQYSLLWRGPEEKVIPLCAAKGVSQIVWSPLAQGVLTGKYLPGAKIPADSRAASDSMGGFMQSKLRPEVLEAVQRLKPLANEAGCSLSQFALAWVLREPNVASAIVGASRPEQLEENAAASGLAVDQRYCIRGHHRRANPLLPQLTPPRPSWRSRPRDPPSSRIWRSSRRTCR